MTEQRTIVGRTWGTSVGKKWVVALTGAVFVLFVIAHMAGNLKIFWGAQAFNAYSEHLRTLGADILGYGGLLWIIRVVLLVSIVLHIWAITALWLRAKRARPVAYQHRSGAAGTYTARTMRWGGVILALFIVWHILDLTTGTVNPDPSAGAYGRLVASFDRPVVSSFYILAMLALGLHISHGLFSAVQTLGGNSTPRQHAYKAGAVVVGAAITVGFVIVPISVMTGLVG